MRVLSCAVTAVLATGCVVVPEPGPRHQRGGRSVAAALASGNWHNEQGLYREAILDFREVITRQPADPAGHAGLGAAYFNNGQDRRAIRALSRALRIESGVAVVHFNLGLVYLRTEQYDEAVEEFLHTIQLDYEYSEAYYRLGLTCLHLGDHECAAESLAVFVRITPRTAATEAPIAVAEEQLGYLQARFASDGANPAQQSRDASSAPTASPDATPPPQPDNVPSQALPPTTPSPQRAEVSADTWRRVGMHGLRIVLCAVESDTDACRLGQMTAALKLLMPSADSGLLEEVAAAMLEGWKAVMDRGVTREAALQVVLNLGSRKAIQAYPEHAFAIERGRDLLLLLVDVAKRGH